MRCHRDKNLDWTPEEENAAKDCFMQLKAAFNDIKNGDNKQIFDFPVLIITDKRTSGLPILISGDRSLQKYILFFPFNCNFSKYFSTRNNQL